MTETQSLPSVDKLHIGALDVKPVERDWTEGYPDEWEYIAAPECLCGHYANWTAAKNDDDYYETWRCVNLDCDDYLKEVEEDSYDAGPMMNYAYPFPVSLDQSDAGKIAHLPLCIVVRPGGSYLDTTYELALTGGGMDLSWEICEAFMRLGYLPPIHFADLPGMAGKGSSERDKWIIAGCRRAARAYAEYATYRAERIAQNLLRFGRGQA